MPDRTVGDRGHGAAGAAHRLEVPLTTGAGAGGGAVIRFLGVDFSPQAGGGRTGLKTRPRPGAAARQRPVVPSTSHRRPRQPPARTARRRRREPTGLAGRTRARAAGSAAGRRGEGAGAAGAAGAPSRHSRRLARHLQPALALHFLHCLAVTAGTGAAAPSTRRAPCADHRSQPLPGPAACRTRSYRSSGDRCRRSSRNRPTRREAGLRTHR